jgi:hypothetical protein
LRKRRGSEKQGSGDDQRFLEHKFLLRFYRCNMTSPAELRSILGRSGTGRKSVFAGLAHRSPVERPPRSATLQTRVKLLRPIRPGFREAKIDYRSALAAPKGMVKV